VVQKLGLVIIGTTHFTPSVVADCTHAYCVQNFAVTQPDSSSQVYSFTFDNIGAVNANPWVTAVQFLDADSTTLLTQNTTYDFSNAPTVTPILRSSTWPTPSGNISQQSTMTWDATLLGNIQTQNDWNFFSGTPPATQYKATKYTYLTNSDNDMVNKKTSIAVYAGSSTTATSSTTRNYDGTATSSLVGATQHDDTNFGTGYNARGNLTSVVTNSLTTTSTYDMTGQVTSVKDSNNHTTSLSDTDNFFDDTTGGPTAHAGSTNSNAYLTKVTNALGWITNVGYYFGSGKLAKTTDFNTATTTHDYLDVMDRPTQVKAPLGWGITSFTSASQIDSYTGIGDVTPSTSCSSCRHDQVELDSLGRISIQSLLNDPEGASAATTSYDSSIGRVQSVTNPKRSGPNPTDGSDAYTYDGLGRVLTVTHSAGGVVHSYYGAKVTSTVGGITAQLCSTATYGFGYPTLVVDEAGMKRETWADGFGRAIEVDEPDNSNNLTTKTCYTYDVLNNLLTVTQGSQSRSYVYDSSSRLTAASAPESGTVNYYYTTSGGALCSGNPAAVCRRTDARSITATYAYDALNRMTGITYSDMTHAVTYSYDSGTNQKGFRTGMTDGSGSTTWANNLAGLVLTESRTIAAQVKTISYTYNQDGSLATLTYPSGRIITYTTSNAERTTSAKDVANNIQYAVTASYAPVGAVNSVIYGPATGFTGVTTTAAYNSLGEPTTISATSSGGTAQNLTYSFALPNGNNGSVSAIQNNANSGLSEAFSYDNLNRIMSAKTTATSGAGCWGQSFGPTGPPAGPADDVYSNLTQIGVTNCSAGSLGIAVSPTTNRITTTSYLFDAAGNMTQEAVPNGYGYTYDAENHLTQATGTATGTWTYVYDGSGMRVKKLNASGGTLYWRTTSGAAIAETDLSGNITSEYAFFDGQRIARRDASNNVYYYYSDQVGSTTAVTTASGTPCYEATFTPYGEEHNTVNTCPQNYKFTGYERDSETGLDYAFARHYNSRLGRFMSTDPMGGDASDPQSLNRYAYVANNPTVFTDPSGLKIVDCVWSGNCGGWNSPGGPSYFGGGGAPCTLDGLDAACGGFGGLGSNDIEMLTTVAGHQFGQNSDGTWFNLANGQELNFEAAAEIGLFPLTFNTTPLNWLPNAVNNLKSFSTSSSKCAKDLKAVGLTPDSVQNYANTVKMVNALTSGYISGWPSGIDMVADTTVPTPTIAYNSYYFWQTSFGQMLGTVVHEYAHFANPTLGDGGIQAALGLTVNSGSSTNISMKFARDCFNGAKSR
jgi:RHS repeat-associated protein